MVTYEEIKNEYPFNYGSYKALIKELVKCMNATPGTGNEDVERTINIDVDNDGDTDVRVEVLKEN